MDKKPYHHIYKDGKLFAFRNLEGGPKRDPNFKWNWKVFSEEKKKLEINYPSEHVIDKLTVLKNLKKKGSDVMVNTSFNISKDPIVFDLYDVYVNMKRMGIKFILMDDGLYQTKDI